MPLYLFKSVEAFAASIEKHVRRELAHGRYGWEVTDCVVTMVEASYSVADGPPSKRGPTSTSFDYRKVTPIVARRALDRARTRVCEPVLRVFLEVPTDDAATVQRLLGRWGAELAGQTSAGEFTRLEARLVAARLHELQHQLPDLTGGEGTLESRFDGYQPVRGRPPVRLGWRPRNASRSACDLQAGTPGTAAGPRRRCATRRRSCRGRRCGRRTRGRTLGWVSQVKTRPSTSTIVTSDESPRNWPMPPPGAAYGVLDRAGGGVPELQAAPVVALMIRDPSGDHPSQQTPMRGAGSERSGRSPGARVEDQYPPGAEAHRHVATVRGEVVAKDRSPEASGSEHPARSRGPAGPSRGTSASRPADPVASGHDERRPPVGGQGHARDVGPGRCTGVPVSSSVVGASSSATRPVTSFTAKVAPSAA